MHCPLCFTPLPPDGITKIATNTYLSHCVEIFSVQKEINANLNCGNCEGDNSSTAVMYCKECKLGYCEECFSSHKQLKMFRTHKTYPIAHSSEQMANIKEKPETCSSHIDKILDQYCKKCERLVCQDCLEEHFHDDADNVVCCVNELVSEKRNNISENIFQLKEQLKLVKNAIAEIEYCEKEVVTNYQERVKEIKIKCEEVQDLLQKEKKDVLEKVKTTKESMCYTLALQKEQLQLVEMQMSICEKFSTDAIEANNTKTLINYSEWIVTRVDELLSQGDTSFSPECTAGDMKLEMVPHHPLICTVTPDVPVLDICGPIVKPSQVKLILTLQDTVKSPVKEQSNILEIRCSHGKEFLKDKKVEENPNGYYHIFYQPNEKIIHSLSIYWHGIALHKDKIRVPINIRDYVNITEVEKSIEKYGQNNKEIKNPYLLGKGPGDMLFVRDDSSKQLVVFKEKLQYLHAIGGEGNGKGKFRDITGIACSCKSDEKNATLYVADGNLNCIQVFKWNTTKKRFEFVSDIGGYGSKDGQFQFPCGLYLSQSGCIFVCDRDNHRIQVYDNEIFLKSFGKHGTGKGNFNKPVDVTLNSRENQIFVSDSLNNRIQVFTIEGSCFAIFDDPAYKLQNPAGIDFSPDGHLLVSCTGSNCISVLEEDGKLVKNIEGLSTPCGIAVMKNGCIVIACGENNKIVIF